MADAFALRIRVLTIDRELLILAALYRVLLQNGCKDLSELCRFEYQSLSHKVGAKAGDALGFRLLISKQLATSAA